MVSPKTGGKGTMRIEIIENKTVGKGAIKSLIRNWNQEKR